MGRREKRTGEGNTGTRVGSGGFLGTEYGEMAE